MSLWSLTNITQNRGSGRALRFGAPFGTLFSWEGRDQVDKEYEVISSLKGGLVVSCQADEATPMFAPAFKQAMALSALQGGARGIRANGPADIRAIKESVPLPMIGINKGLNQRGVRTITPTLTSAREVVEAGAEIVAVECTFQAWPDAAGLKDLLAAVAAELRVPIMADIATVAEAERAMALGATFVATTMSGYTADTADRNVDGVPDLELISLLKASLGDVPVLAEGRFWTPEQAVEALQRGAHCVCVGTAITAPWAISRRFVSAMR